MHGWPSLDTARCATCAIYTPTTDLLFGPDGHRYCVLCGIPSGERERRATARGVDDWIEVPRTPLARAARWTVAAMLVATLLFPLAACASQL